MKNANERGFTLIELLVTLAITSIVVAGIFSVYRIQLRMKVGQEEMLDLQQNLRAAMHVIEKDLRMARYDPLGTAGAGFETMLANRIEFTQDIDSDAGDGNPDGDLTDPNERVGYEPGTPINGVPTLSRRRIGTSGSTVAPIAENIDAINFVYLDPFGTPTSDPLSVNSIQVTLVGRVKHEPIGDAGTVNNRAYRNLQGAVIYQAPGDRFIRMTLSSEIKCRN